MIPMATCARCRHLLCRKCHKYHAPDAVEHRSAGRYCRLAKGQGMKLAAREWHSPACTMIDSIDQPAVSVTPSADPSTGPQEVPTR